MRSISEDEKKTATLIAVGDVLSDVDDTEAAFEDFRSGFKEGDEPGTVRAFELQIDERGNVGTTKMQMRLGAWPIDAYKFDELCSMLIRDYMTPDQQRMAVRLVGTRKEQTGYVFNKIVMLKRSLAKESSSNGSDTPSSLMKAMQEMNERNMAMFQRMMPHAEKTDSMADLQKLITVSQALNSPMTTMLNSLLPALLGRPAPTVGADPFSSLNGLLDVVEKLNDLRGGGDSGASDDGGIASIIRAITPLAKPALEALPAIAAMQARSPAAAPPRSIPAPVKPTPPPAALAPDPTKTPTTPPPPAAPVTAIQPTDIPSGDSQMLAQLKPQIDSLVAMAGQGSDPVAAADLIFDQVLMSPALSDTDYENLANFVDSDKFVPYVIVMNPAAKPYENWFAQFKAQVVARLLQEDAPNQPSTPSNPVPRLES